MDGVHRLFVMPFSTSDSDNYNNYSSAKKTSINSSASSPTEAHAEQDDRQEIAVEFDSSRSPRAGQPQAEPQQHLTMWQLSFSGLDEVAAAALRSCSPAELLAEALRRVSGWMPPVERLVAATR